MFWKWNYTSIYSMLPIDNKEKPQQELKRKWREWKNKKKSDEAEEYKNDILSRSVEKTHRDIINNFVPFHLTQCGRKVQFCPAQFLLLHGAPLTLYCRPLFFTSSSSLPSPSRLLSSQKRSDSHLLHIRPTLWLEPLCIHAGLSAWKPFWQGHEYA